MHEKTSKGMKCVHGGDTLRASSGRETHDQPVNRGRWRVRWITRTPLDRQNVKTQHHLSAGGVQFGWVSLRSIATLILLIGVMCLQFRRCHHAALFFMLHTFPWLLPHFLPSLSWTLLCVLEAVNLIRMDWAAQLTLHYQLSLICFAALTTIISNEVNFSTQYKLLLLLRVHLVSQRGMIHDRTKWCCVYMVSFFQCLVVFCFCPFTF